MSQYSQGGLLEEFKGAFSKPDNALIQIILINLVVFLGLILLRVLLTLTVSPDAYDVVVSYLMLPSSLGKFFMQPWTIFTYFVAHEGILHFAFNMLWLYWFGKIVKEYLGSKRIVGLYILGGIAGGFFYMLVYNLVPFYADRVDGSMMLGASAGVLAIVVGAATFMPNFTVFLMFLGPVKIKYIALLSVVLSFAQSTGDNAGGELAHLGGAALGFIFIKQLQAGNDWSKPVTWFTSFVMSFFVHQPKMKVTDNRSKKSKTRNSSTPEARPQKSQRALDQDEIDAILDKISQSGYDSLTKDEKERLFNASKK